MTGEDFAFFCRKVGGSLEQTGRGLRVLGLGGMRWGQEGEDCACISRSVAASLEIILILVTDTTGRDEENNP